MQSFTRSQALTTLTHAPDDVVKTLAEQVMPSLGDITVLQNRTGLVMLPYTDSTQGTVFHLGEVLVAEARVRIMGETEGYGMVVGRDVELALGIAILDAALAADIMTDEINAVLEAQTESQASADDAALRKVASTRVEMETF